MDLKGKHVLVLGLGSTGVSAVNWLKSKGADVQAADTRQDPPGASRVGGIRVSKGPFRLELLEGIDLVAVSPGLSLDEPLIREAKGRGIPVLGDVELFAREIRQWRPKVIAITGSNGKSTVTSMVGEMCRKGGLDTVVAGNIGLPVLDTLGSRHAVYVLELSSFQLETLESLDADSATVLNLSEDHLDRYASMEEYGRAKEAIFRGSGLQVLNRDDPATLSMALAGRPRLTFGASAPASDTEYGLVKEGNEMWLARGGRKLMKASDLPVAGLHNAENALASLALCSFLDIPEEIQIRALMDFKGLPHRVERIGELEGVTFYDDSKGTNVGATVAALKGLAGKVVLILGGDGKGQDFSPLKEPVENHARAVVLIGRDAPIIERALGSKIPVFHAKDMDEAVAKAFGAAQGGDSVLLSPACASFDMFRNYVHRAEAFADAFGKIGSCRPS